MRSLKKTKVDVSRYDINLYDEIIECLVEMDYEKILKVMNLLDWKYFDVEKMTVELLRKTAERMIFSAVSNLIHENKNDESLVNTATSTGGFTASAYFIDEPMVVCDDCSYSDCQYQCDDGNGKRLCFDIVFAVETVGNN